VSFSLLPSKKWCLQQFPILSLVHLTLAFHVYVEPSVWKALWWQVKLSELYAFLFAALANPYVKLCFFCFQARMMFATVSKPTFFMVHLTFTVHGCVAVPFSLGFKLSRL
jgi:hypothetical protein